MTKGQIIEAFTEEQTSVLTGITKSQLRNWDQSGFFVPTLADGNRRAAYSRLYNFSDLLSLKVLYKLRVDHEISFPKLKIVKSFLKKLDNKLWHNQTLYVLNRNVVYEQPRTGEREEIGTGQGVFEIPLKVVAGSLENDLATLRSRDKSKIGKIEKTRNVRSSQPTVAGTRIPVSTIIEFASEGYSREAILKEFPALELKDIDAALNYDEAI